MNALDVLVMETLKRIKAAGGRAWIAPDASDEMKLSFLVGLIDGTRIRKQA